MGDILCGKDFWEFTYIALIYASAANVVATLIIREIFNTAPLFIGVLSFPNKKNALLPGFSPWVF